MKHPNNHKFKFEQLDWDTKYFGVKAAKAILYETLTDIECKKIVDLAAESEFVSITNRNSDVENSRLISKFTNAFIVDINMEFTKNITSLEAYKTDVEISNRYVYDESLLSIANYNHSKFIQDSKLKERGGKDVYRNWIINSFEQDDKYFATIKNGGNTIGYALFNMMEGTVTIELIAVNQNVARRGNGKKLIESIEQFASRNGCTVLKVGTQILNSEAVHLYHKVGLRQVGCHQTYHLWNLEDFDKSVRHSKSMAY